MACRLNQCWDIVNWTLKWNFNRNSNIFTEETMIENVVCKMLHNLSRPQYVNTLRPETKWQATCSNGLSLKKGFIIWIMLKFVPKGLILSTLTVLSLFATRFATCTGSIYITFLKEVSLIKLMWNGLYGRCSICFFGSNIWTCLLCICNLGFPGIVTEELLPF